MVNLTRHAPVPPVHSTQVSDDSPDSVRGEAATPQEGDAILMLG